MSSKIKETWRVEASTLIASQKVFIFYLFSWALTSFLTFHEGIDNLLEHAIPMRVINPRSTPSRSTLLSQVSQEQQVFCQTFEQRDACCIMSGIPSPCNASHIISYAYENALPCSESTP